MALHSNISVKDMVALALSKIYYTEKLPDRICWYQQQKNLQNVLNNLWTFVTL